VLRFLTAGESHGPSITAILEGMPAGLPLTPDDLGGDMRRRQKGYGSGGRMGIEKDRVRFTGGLMDGRTTGGPIALHIENRDWANWRDKEIPPMTVPRPGHADLTGSIKYGYRDLRLALERASARETAARVAAGGVCRRLLAEFEVLIGSYVLSIGDVVVPLSLLAGQAARQGYLDRFEAAEANEVRCPDPEAAGRMRQTISETMQAKDTLGGVFEVVALRVPAGLGSHVHWDRRLDARLLWAVASIQAVKGVEIGPAFENARLRGTQVHDQIFVEDSEGAVALTRRAMKPISTTLTPLRSVDLASGQPAATQYERSDFCAVPRAAVVGEAMVAFVLAGALIEKLGGDSLSEMRPRFDALRQGRLDELPMDGEAWRFGYE
jgi:chorismate synthase